MNTPAPPRPAVLLINWELVIVLILLSANPAPYKTAVLLMKIESVTFPFPSDITPPPLPRAVLFLKVVPTMLNEASTLPTFIAPPLVPRLPSKRELIIFK